VTCPELGCVIRVQLQYHTFDSFDGIKIIFFDTWIQKWRAKTGGSEGFR
jgi:hypothetical protein